MKVQKYLEESIFILCSQAYLKLSQHVTSQLATYDTNILQAMILVFLYIEDEEIYPNELADLFGKSRSSISAAIACLEEKKWIARNLENNDKRFFRLVIAEDGKKIAPSLLEVFQNTEDSIEKTFKAPTLSGLRNNFKSLIGIVEPSKEEEKQP